MKVVYLEKREEAKKETAEVVRVYMPEK